jgi:hypothetical protein
MTRGEAVRAQEARALEHSERALDFRKAGATFRQIGAALGLSHEAARQAYHRAIRLTVQTLTQAAAEEVALFRSRLDTYRARLWAQLVGTPGPNPEDARAIIAALMRVDESERRLIGVDAERGSSSGPGENPVVLETKVLVIGAPPAVPEIKRPP